MIDGMKRLVILGFWLLGLIPALAAPLRPRQVAVVYNSASADSKKLAEIYRDARGIPNENLIGLEMPVTQDISREVYQKTIREPLMRTFQERGWWRLAKEANGIILPIQNEIRVLLMMKGVPLRIQPGPLPAGLTVDPKDMIGGRNEASVDSELALFGVQGPPAEGILKNPLYQTEKSISEANFPFFVATARIDAPRLETCERMIQDAIETEKTGLWGRAYIDIANKYPEGDQWLEEIAKETTAAGIPTIVDRFNDTLPTNYPLTDAALYYGWYDLHVSGPFLNSRFYFKKGAVAMHLHSFSAVQLSDANHNWSGGLLERGAAATIGNVYEPYLHLSHHFEILNNRLLAGHTLVDAAWMSIPASSWQGVVLGDPLYRPYAKFDNSGPLKAEDNDYRALRAASIQWQEDPVELQKQLIAATERTGSGILKEAVGLGLLQRGNPTEAGKWFLEAKYHYVKEEDKVRQDFHLIGMERLAGRKDSALAGIREAQARYGSLPEAQGLRGWMDILDPPPPAPVGK
jgi:uncharacterized protein (TIGR03790 family)